jgi:hypothetical protein
VADRQNIYLPYLPTSRAICLFTSRENRPRMKNRRRILSDHKQQGKILVPPFTHILGPIGEVSWIKTILPELLWIALIHNLHGHRRAVEIITAFSRSARNVNVKPNFARKWFAAASDYTSLSPAGFEQLRLALRQQKLLDAILVPLKPLVNWYPECPLAPLFTEPIQTQPAGESIARSQRQTNKRRAFARRLFRWMPGQAQA